MRRAVFFAMLACGSPAPPPEVAEPLPAPAVTASASAAPAAVVKVDDAIGDARDLRQPPRSRALLEREAPLLEKLFAASARNAPDRAMVLHRLAETYVELRKDGEADAGPKAIAYFTKLANEYPSYAKIDEVRYDLALEHESAGDFNNARRVYYELIKGSPSSRFVPYAYYAFGEIFTEEAKADPSKRELAEQAYKETMKFSTSPIAKLASCRLSRGSDCGGT